MLCALCMLSMGSWSRVHAYVVDDAADVGLINAHAKCQACYHH